MIGTVTIAAIATDDGAIASVRFQVDGVPLDGVDSEAPYAVTWSTQGIPTGPHTVTAIARDAAGNEAAAAVTVIVAAALPDGGGN